MADISLRSDTPAAGLGLPVSEGDVTLAEAPWEPAVSVMPHRGRQDAVSAALASAFGCGLPAPGGTAERRGVRILWMGHGHWLVCGADAGAAVGACGEAAALTDQSDAWAVLRLTGGASRDVLARLCPLDLDPAVFPEGATARSELQHMMASLTAIAEGFEIRVMRSFAATAVHDLRSAMRSVALQRRMGEDPG